jgi:hypothetical protein
MSVVLSGRQLILVVAQEPACVHTGTVPCKTETTILKCSPSLGGGMFFPPSLFLSLSGICICICAPIDRCSFGRGRGGDDVELLELVVALSMPTSSAHWDVVSRLAVSRHFSTLVSHRNACSRTPPQRTYIVYQKPAIFQPSTSLTWRVENSSSVCQN